LIHIFVDITPSLPRLISSLREWSFVPVVCRVCLAARCGGWGSAGILAHNQPTVSIYIITVETQYNHSCIAHWRVSCGAASRMRVGGAAVLHHTMTADRATGPHHRYAHHDSTLAIEARLSHAGVLGEALWQWY